MSVFVVWCDGCGQEMARLDGGPKELLWGALFASGAVFDGKRQYHDLRCAFARTVPLETHRTTEEK